MASNTPAPPAPPKRRLKKRLVIPLAILVLLGLVVLWAYVRGTSADTAPRDPTSAADGVACQLLRTADGNTPVRCAVRIDRPLDEVWAVITDYERYGDIFPTLVPGSVKVDRDESKRPRSVHLSGTATSLLGDWPFDVHIAQEESQGKRTASWKTSDPDVPVNRGSFELTAAGEGQTLLVYSLEVELASYPNFIVRNVLLSRQPKAVRGIVDRLKK